MKWFKHFTAAKHDPKIRLLLAEFGFEGYGLYWMILETIAEDMDWETENTAATMTRQQWCNSVKISPKKFQKILVFCSENFHFFIEKHSNLITINCPKLLEIRDEYTKKKGRKSGQAPDS